jgi:hypothetical protein
METIIGVLTLALLFLALALGVFGLAYILRRP